MSQWKWRGYVLGPLLLLMLVVTVAQRRPYSPPKGTATRSPSSTTVKPVESAPPKQEAIRPITELPGTIPATPPTILTADKITFPARRPGQPTNVAQTRTICGDPRENGPYTLRIRIPSGIVPMPHVHPDTRMSVVLEGTYCFGYGEEIDEKAVFELGPGSFFTEPAGVPHFGWAKAGTTVVIQSTGFGPSGTAIVPRRENAPPDRPR